MTLAPLRQAVLTAGVRTSLARAYASEGLLPRAAELARTIGQAFDHVPVSGGTARAAVARIRRDAEDGARLLDAGARTVADDQLQQVRRLITELRDLP